MRDRLTLLGHRAAVMVRTVVPELLQGVFFFGGLAAIAFGIGMFSRGAGVIIGGIEALWVSFLLTGK